MPKIPLYETQAQPAESTRPFLKDPESEGMVGRAIQKGVAQVSARLEEYQKERDILSASEALSKFADDERQYHKGEFELQGEQAQGSQTRGNEFYLQATEKHGQNLTGNAKKIFTQKALQYREYGLDKLATHEAKQHQVWKQSSFDKMKTLAEQDIKTGATKEKVLQNIDDLKTHIRELHKGVDTTEMEAQLEETMLKSYLVEQAGTNPSAARDLLAEFSGKIAESDRVAIEGFAEKVEVTQAVERYASVLNAENGVDYAKSMKEVQNLPISDKAKKALKTRLNDEYHTNKMIRDAQKKEAQDSTLNGVVTKYANGDFVGVRKIIDGATWLEPHQREHWYDKLDAREKAIETGKLNAYNISDPEIEGLVTRAVVERPDDVPLHKIWDFHGNGLSTQTCKELSAKLTTIKNQKNEHIRSEVKRASEMIETWRKEGTLDPGKLWGFYGGGPNTEDAHRTKLKALNGALAFIQQYPDRDVVEDFLIPYKQELTMKRVDEAFAKFNQQNTPREHQPVRGKIPKTKQAINDDEFYRNWLGGTNPFAEVMYE